MAVQQLHEHGRGVRLSEAEGARRRVLIITPGFGSSGYYPAEVLQRDAPTAFAEGSHYYVDHLGEMEAADRQRVGRSIRDLAAVQETAGRYDENGPEGPGVYATVRVMPSYESMIDDLAPHIGVSIRGSGEAHFGEVEGREAMIVDSLAPVESVDFVAKAGRGGKVLQLVESARTADLQPDQLTDRYLIEAETRLREARNVGAWHEAHLHLAFTERADHAYADGKLTRDERIALSGAIGAALDAFRADLEANAPHLYERDPHTDPDPTPTPVETTESRTDPAEEAGMTIEEAQARITELEGNLSTVESARDTAIGERDEARDQAARLNAEQTATVEARRIVAESDHDLPAPAVDRVVRESLRDLPMTEGRLDTDAFAARVTEAAASEAAYLGTTQAGTKIVGLGEAVPTTPTGDVDKLREANAERAAKLLA